MSKIEMTALDYKQILSDEGFPIVYEWTDKPNTTYPPHSHQGKVSFYILKGSLSFTLGINKTLAQGDRIDVPVNLEHAVLVGKDGCTYMVGQEIEGDA